MCFKNSLQKYGLITKLLHWSIAILIILQFSLIYYRQYMLLDNDPNSLFIMINLHKPLGVIILTLGFIMLLWRFNNLKPEFSPLIPAWEKVAANLSHATLYICMLLMPISGVAMSLSAGYPISMFGAFNLPITLEKNLLNAKLFGEIHTITSYILLTTLVIHFLATIKHHFIDKDNILKRIL